MRPDQNTANELDLSDVNSYKKMQRVVKQWKEYILLLF